MVKIHEYSDYNVDTVFRQGVVVVPEKLVHDAELNEVLQDAIKVFPLKKKLLLKKLVQFSSEGVSM
jgi:hypothetical protein